MDRKEIIDDVLRVYREFGKLTRKLYRKEGMVPEKVWNEAFGSFTELKKSAGIDDSRYSKKLQSRQAKNESERVLREFNDKLLPYNDKYVKHRDTRFKTLLVAGDFHDKDVDPFALSVFIDTAKRMQPDVIVLNGDLYDMPEISRYTKDLRSMDMVGRMKFVHDNILAPLRDVCPDSQIDMIAGNHDCLSTDTEILTKRGWLKWDEWTEHDELLTLDKDGNGVWQKPTAKVVKHYTGKMYHIEAQMVTPNHRVIYKTSDGDIKETLAKEYKGGSIPTTVKLQDRKGVDLADDEIRLIGWNGNTKLPDWVSDMSDRQFEIFLDTLIKADGSVHKASEKALMFYGKREICEDLQVELITRGYRATLREYRTNQFRLNIQKGREFTRQDNYFREVDYNGVVWCAVVPNENFMIRRNGSPSITGNCRLLNHLAESNSGNNIQILLSDLHGWTFANLLGLDKFEINLITKKDMMRYDVSPRKKEIPKNFKVYFDSYLVVHDPKEGEKLGMPGCSNHHHRPKVTQYYSIDRGAYQWHWLGCMVVTDAEYCNGEKWTRGFGIVHIDTETKQTQTENVIINGDSVCVLGKYYTDGDI